jgi:hypothetical protein
MKKVTFLTVLCVFLLLAGNNALADTSAAAAASASASTASSIGGETNNNFSNLEKRDHITAIPGAVGNFIGASGFVASKDWHLFACQPLFKNFTVEELEVMSEGAGGWFSSGIQKSLRIKKVSSCDENPIIRLDFIPTESTDRILGEYEYESKEPMPLGKALAHVLIEAKKDLNVHRVVVWMRLKGEVENSGLSIGSGVAGARLGGHDVDSSVGAIGLGGLIGTTTARTQEVYAVRVWAFNDGPIVPPCNSDVIREEIKELGVKISQCKNWCFNNMFLRFQKANVFAELAICSGENGYLSEAIKDYAIAEKNYLNGEDISSDQFLADQILQKVYWNWAACIREKDGRDTEIIFAREKEMTMMPTEISEIIEQ